MMHVPVLHDAVVDLLEPLEGKVILDATVGTGGYAQTILERLGPRGRYIGIDADESALLEARGRLESYERRLTLIQSNYSRLAEVLNEIGEPGVDGVIMDLGLSSLQVDDSERGFSFQQEGPLDMRMDRRQPVTARELVNRLDELKLGGLLREYGQERFSGRIAAAIVRARKMKRIETTGELAGIVAGAVARRLWPKRIHPATRTFQALRIAVNDELGSLQEGLKQAADSLRSLGRLIVLSYHSLEDRIVKNFFKSRHGKGWRILTKKPVVPDEAEIARNRRARSAKMRVLERVS